MIPELDTARLRLRGHVPTDLDDCVALWSDPVVVEHTIGRSSTREEVWARLLRYVGHWRLLGYGFWAVTERVTGRFVGEVGFADFKRDLVPSLGDTPEMGWVLLPAFHGQGLATEAVRAALAWGDTRFPSGTACIVAPENGASLRVAHKNDFREARRVLYKGSPTVVLERPRMHSA